MQGQEGRLPLFTSAEALKSPHPLSGGGSPSRGAGTLTHPRNTWTSHHPRSLVFTATSTVPETEWRERGDGGVNRRGELLSQ